MPGTQTTQRRICCLMITKPTLETTAFQLKIILEAIVLHLKLFETS